MKRFAGFLVLVICLLFSVYAYAEVVPVTMGKGGDKDNPVKLEAGVLYYLENSYGWHYIVPEESGLFTFFTRSIKSGYTFQIVNKYQEELWNMKLYGSNKEDRTASIQLVAGEKYRVFIGTIDAFTNNDLAWFTICSPSEHVSYASAEIRQAATCETAGYMAQTCEYCGGEGERTVIPATGHHSGGVVTMQAATCLSTGLDTDVCANCGEVLSTLVTPITDHEAGAWQDERKATCISEGFRVQLCTGCGMTMGSEVVPALGHSVSEWKEESARCTIAGKRYRDCTVCGAELESVEIPMKGHTYSEWIETVVPTTEYQGQEARQCLSCGETQTRPVDKLTWLQGIFGR